jgi:hypothetical protein
MLSYPFVLCCLTSHRSRTCQGKDYGDSSLLGRSTATHLRCLTGRLMSTYGKQSILEEIELIRVGESRRFEQIVEAPKSALESGVMSFAVDLILPTAKATSCVSRRIGTHEFDVQVSERYKYRDTSRFLLVTNAATPPSITGCIKSAVQGHVDGFNVSHYGSFKEPVIGQKVVSLYEGKSIIICANPFPYSHSGQRETWQLLDAWEVARLTKSDTSFCFLGVTDSKALQEWCKMLHFPLSSATVEPSLDATGLNGLIAGLDPMHHAFTVRKPGHLNYQYSSNQHHLSFSRDLMSALLNNAQKDSAKLSKVFICTPPLRLVAKSRAIQPRPHWNHFGIRRFPGACQHLHVKPATVSHTR